MVLAAGEGTRLRPLTLALPKPMVPVAHIPLLVRTLELLRTQGVVDIAVNLYHRPEAIRDALGDGAAYGVRLHYSEETRLMGTAGGVKRAEGFLDETFVVLYGDNLYRFDLAPLAEFHRRARALATMATFTAPNPSACGLVLTDAEGRVTRFQEKPPPEQVFTDQANAGVYLLEPDLLRQIPAESPCDFGHDIFPALLARFPGRIFARSLEGYLRDTGTLESYRQANWDIMQGRAGPSALAVDPTAQVDPEATLSGNYVVGPGCQVEAGAALGETILWSGCRIGEGARVHGAILGRGVSVGAGAHIETDAILADGATVDPGARVESGARIGPGERVK